MIYIAEHLRSRVYERVVSLAADKQHIDLDSQEIRSLFRRKKIFSRSNTNEAFRRTRLAGRAFDIALSLVGLVALAPLFVVIAALIKFDSGGPILYRNLTRDEDGNNLFLYRFRTHGDGHKITSVGSFLRKTSLDELPAIFNILDGTIGLPARPWRVLSALPGVIFKVFRI
ncbi:sugar transferase [Mesorhizobium sp. CO1-1-9]|nr:sugar transferase [Mesorhizobium sp. CO1-1-9]